MIDMLVLKIPVDYSLVDVTDDGKHAILGFDLLDLDLKVGSYDVYKNEDGQVQHKVLKHSYEKLPTSYTKMAFKFYHEGSYFPYVELKASPAKILQGHNVYGSDVIEHGVLEMLGYLATSQPTLYGMLAVSETEVQQIDITYSARLKDDKQVEQVKEFLRNVTTQHIRKSTKECSYQNTIYFGSSRCKRFARKVYGKKKEFDTQLKEYEYLAKLNDQNAKRVFNAMSCPKLQKWATGLLRFESGVKAYVMKEKGIPTNVFELIRYQRENPKFTQQIWAKSFEQIFEALKGTAMKATDHDSVFDHLCSVYETVTKSGRRSITKARNLFNFYCALETHGVNGMKSKFGQRQFYQNMADLVNAGYSKAFLQNLHIESKNNVVPFLKFVEIKFDEQLPPDFVEPVSQFSEGSFARLAS